MTLDFLNDYLVLVVVGICLCVGFIIKKIDFVPNKFIPLIVGLLGLVINMWANGWMLTPEIMLGGFFSGLSATGLYEMFENLINKNGGIINKDGEID